MSLKLIAREVLGQESSNEMTILILHTLQAFVANELDKTIDKLLEIRKQ